jgi:hypothetical protein
MTTFKIAISKYELDQKIPFGDPFWTKFNASFDNVETETTDVIDAVYNGRAITTHHKDHWRTGANYLAGQHLGLDFDAGDKSSDMYTLVNDKFISRYASFLYTTISHTQESPRCRVIFVLDTPILQAKNYTMAASAMLWMFGAADRQCKDAVRFFYGAKDCSFQFLDNILPIEMVKRLIQNYQDTGMKEKRQASKDYAAPASQQEVADALALIPPWQIDYDEWVSVLMGVHSQFGDAGYSLAESWADGKPKEVEGKWKSFNNNGNTSGAITIATVFGIAKRFGWKGHNNGGL